MKGIIFGVIGLGAAVMLMKAVANVLPKTYAAKKSSTVKSQISKIKQSAKKGTSEAQAVIDEINRLLT